MKFTKLKITGFKSFVDTTELDIKEGLTGLVGPNGCGKSNIVEAMKWNMGEAGPSRLRAGEMNDLIFAGTKGRASRNSAEVVRQVGCVVTSATSDHWLIGSCEHRGGFSIF